MLTKSYLSSIVLIGSGALVAAVLAMQATTPAAIGPVGVTGWFLLILIGLCSLIAAAAYVLAARLQKRQPAARLRIANSARRGLLVGGALTIILGLNSLQQLNPRDVILLVVLGVLVEFYVVARS